MTSELHITGLADLQKMLDSLPSRIEKNILSGALRAGANVLKADAKARCPVGPPSATGAKRYKLYEGALRDSIRVSVKAKGGRVTASVKAGGKLKNGANVWYAHIIEFTGAKAHKIDAKLGSALSFAGGKYKSVDHPGMNAKPFMRPAFDSQAANAIQAAGEYIKQRLATKESLDTSAIDISVKG